MNVSKLKDELAQMSERGVVEVEIRVGSDTLWYDFKIDVSNGEHALIYLTKCVMG